jgi:hypothetical protein
MRITTELLHEYAKTTVEKITREDYTILAVYLTGSILTEQDPFLGGTTDIDLVFVHIGDPQAPREILRLNDDIHYDIAHHPQRKYRDRLSLRLDPRMGPVLSEAVVLYDPQHFMDLTQASVRGLFHLRENVIQRANTQLNSARTDWFKFQPAPENPGPQDILQYLTILNSAANSIALLGGETLTERRFLINFHKHAGNIQKPGLYHGLLGMLGAAELDKDLLVSWVSTWKQLIKTLPKEKTPLCLHPYRHRYYLKAFEVIMESDQPTAILWPLLYTWTQVVESLTESDLGFQNWRDALDQVGLLGNGFAERILALDAFLDQLENVITTWDLSDEIP